MNANIAESRSDGANASSASFVINLCASTSPMALQHPSSPELKRYTFFVSRQREEGRERFRLHMGYFPSQEDAESLLTLVRDVYPAAWAGPAPSTGATRRARSTPVPPVVAAPVAVVPAVAPVAPPSAPAPVAAKPAAVPALEAMSNVRDVLARLSDQPSREATVAAEAAPPRPAVVPRLKPRPAAPAVQSLAVQPAVKVQPAMPAQPAVKVQPVAAAKMSRVAAASRELTDRGALQLLEPAPAGQEPDVRVMTPEDTQTLTDIRLDAQNNAPPCFAVQLVWSVSPIDVTALPHLAIFDAYTLYNVEGNRQGRKWYGLRLGFFSDPNSATQVAHYVRSDYRSVAVVPVATKERDRATGGAPVAAAMPRLGEVAVPLKAEADVALARESLDGFELLADDRPAPVKRDLDDASTATATATPAVAPKKKPPELPRATGRPTGKRVVVRKRPEPPRGRAAPGAPQPLESTLEILGASTLTIDESREIINDSAVRQPLKKTPSGNRFSKLLSRLSGG